MAKALVKEREFAFTQDDFDTLCRLIMDYAGIKMHQGKEDMIYGRVSRRVRKLGLRTFSEYVDLLEEDPSGEEMGRFVNAVTTNMTSFFREQHHFEYMKQTLLPELMEHHKTDHRIRIWSAGCSSGEEPYSIAMTMAETMPTDWDARILATDLDTDMVAHAAKGIYESKRVNGLAKGTVRRWFSRNRKYPDKVKIKSSLQEMITFRKLNLLHGWPMHGPLDAIFCRNVIIYFDTETKRKLMARYADLLAPHGRLFLGHSESLLNISDQFRLCGKSIYVKENGVRS